MNAHILTLMRSITCDSGSAQIANHDTNLNNKENNMSEGSMAWWKFIDDLDRRISKSNEETSNDNG